MYVSPATDALPHEPKRVRAAAPRFLLTLAVEGLAVVLLTAAGAPLWPLFLLSVVVWGWPPHVDRPVAWPRLLRLVLTARPPAPGTPPLSRLWLVLRAARQAALLPFAGLAWAMDEVLYGRALRDTPVRAPLVVLSAARSGSTRLSHTLEDDPRLVAPNALQELLPYLWLWRLAARLPLHRLPVDAMFDRARARFPVEFIQRHGVEPLRSDTFEAAVLVNRVAVLGAALGPDALLAGFSAARSYGDPVFWTGDFVALLDRIGRKALVFAGPGPDGRPRRLYVKGHFQASDDALALAWPDAHFLTVVREPVGRIRSFANHLHGAPIVEPLGALPWAWLAEAVPAMEAAYCEREQQWFSAEQGPARTVVRFRDFVGDLEGTLTHVYRRCFGDDAPPPYVRTTHPPREHERYLVDRDLEALGVDTAALARRLAPYRSWVDGLPK